MQWETGLCCQEGEGFKPKTDMFCHNTESTNDFVSVQGRDEGYAVKYNPLSEGVLEGTPEGERFYFTVYPKLSPNTNIISF